MRIFFTFNIVLLVLLTSCLDEDSRAGGNWVESTFYNVLTDSCTVKISTLLADSVSTSGDTVCQIGHYKDELRGQIRGSYFTEYNTVSSSLDREAIYELDSVTFSLRFSGDYLGDTLSRQTMHMHRLTELIELHSDDYLYNTSSVAYEETPFHTFSFLPRPTQKEEIEIRLPHEFGQEFFDLMLSQSSILDTQDYFRQYFAGICFREDETNNCITGFGVSDTSMYFTLHYRKIEEDYTELTTVFTPHSSQRFNRATQDRTGTPIESLEPGSYFAMPSSESRNIAYLQGLTGLYISIEFPYLNDLLKKGDMVSIESATLYFYPVRDTYGSQIPLPETLTLYTANDNNETEGVITDSSGSSVQTGDFHNDDTELNNTYYSFNITSFLQNNLGTFGSNRQKLMLMLPTDKYITTMGGIILGDMEHPQNNVKLELLYKVYNK